MSTGVCSTEGGGTAVIDGDHLFIAGGWGGIAVFDLKVPDSPRKLAQKETGVCSSGGMATVCIANGHAYVAGGGGFAITNAAKPGSCEKATQRAVRAACYYR